MHYNCLIIDDETDLAKMTCEYFRMFDVSCSYTDNADDCMKFLSENETDIILLDINLRNESGFDLCKKIRGSMDIPILFISARQSDDDILIALNIGGDDYIKKPYTLSVLLAKVKVMLKRMASVREISSDAVRADNISVETDKGDERLYLDKGKFSVCIDGRTVKLKAKEFALLECLYAHKNTIVTKEELFNSVWGDSFYGDGTLNVHIRRLREKIEENPNEPQIIKTVWGTGYVLNTEEGGKVF